MFSDKSDCYKGNASRDGIHKLTKKGDCGFIRVK